jgi:glyoxylase-like metal-dependent hydrolase (beta-lactamase superfamily II)
MVLKSLLGAAGALAIGPAILARGQATTSAASGPATTQAAPPMPFDTNKIETQSLASGIGWGLDLITGPGGNIAVFHGKDGTLVVDCGVPSRGKEVLEFVKKVSVPSTVGAVVDITPHGPLKLLVNTHWHFDHTGGNGALAAAGATIIAHENTYKRLSEKITIEFFKMTAEPVPESARPVVTFADSNTIRLNDETITLTHVAPAHTDTDIIVHFKNADIIHAGDLVFNGAYPFIDYSTNGSVSGMIAAVDTIRKMMGEKTRVIPGHGPVATAADLKKFRDMMATVQKSIRGMIAAGKSIDDVVAAKPTAAYDAALGGGLLNGEMFTKLVYTIESKKA